MLSSLVPYIADSSKYDSEIDDLLIADLLVLSVTDVTNIKLDILV